MFPLCHLHHVNLTLSCPGSPGYSDTEYKIPNPCGHSPTHNLGKCQNLRTTLLICESVCWSLFAGTWAWLSQQRRPEWTWTDLTACKVAVWQANSEVKQLPLQKQSTHSTCQLKWSHNVSIWGTATVLLYGAPLSACCWQEDICYKHSAQCSTGEEGGRRRKRKKDFCTKRKVSPSVLDICAGGNM